MSFDGIQNAIMIKVKWHTLFTVPLKLYGFPTKSLTPIIIGFTLEHHYRQVIWMRCDRQWWSSRIFKLTSIVQYQTSIKKSNEWPEVKPIFGRFHLAFQFHSTFCGACSRAAWIKAKADKFTGWHRTTSEINWTTCRFVKTFIFLSLSFWWNLDQSENNLHEIRNSLALVCCLPPVPPRMK